MVLVGFGRFRGGLRGVKGVVKGCLGAARFRASLGLISRVAPPPTH